MGLGTSGVKGARGSLSTTGREYYLQRGLLKTGLQTEKDINGPRARHSQGETLIMGQKGRDSEAGFSRNALPTAEERTPLDDDAEEMFAWNGPKQAEAISSREALWEGRGL